MNFSEHTSQHFTEKITIINQFSIILTKFLARINN
jgi:hypothetical protein